jgi:hypothetical protein
MTIAIPENMRADGWREEERPLPDRPSLCISVVCRGEHSDGCRRTDEGWACATDCVVEDMRMINNYHSTVDELIEVREDVSRRYKRIWRFSIPLLVFDYSVTRVSLRRRYTNGRSKAGPSDYSTWEAISGFALLRRRARARMEREIAAEGSKEMYA